MSEPEWPLCVTEKNKVRWLSFWSDTICQVVIAGITLIKCEASGDMWDGATIPRIMQWLAGHPLDEQFRIASLYHDRFCEGAKCAEDRMVGDAVFLALLAQAGVPRWKRWCMWIAVRSYSLFIWNLRLLTKKWRQK